MTPVLRTRWNYAQDIYWRTIEELEEQEQDKMEKWVLQLGRAKRRLGCCHYNKKIIEISKDYLMAGSEEQIANTITHEIAHALLPPSAGHNSEWKRLHQKLGGNGERCGNIPEMAKNYSWEIVCSNGCSVGQNTKTGEILHSLKYYRKPKDVIRTCKKCDNRAIVRKIPKGVKE